MKPLSQPLNPFGGEDCIQPCEEKDISLKTSIITLNTGGPVCEEKYGHANRMSMSPLIQWNLRITDKLVHRLMSAIRRLSFIGGFFCQ